MCKSAERVLQDFARRGLSVSEWARTNGYRRNLVVYVLNGGAARRGHAHDIAVKLGLKDGVLRNGVATKSPQDR